MTHPASVVAIDRNHSTGIDGSDPSLDAVVPFDPSLDAVVPFDPSLGTRVFRVSSAWVQLLH